MKIDGVDPKSLCNEVFLVLPRGEEQIVFRARGLKDMKEFQERCPAPKPPGKMTKDGLVPMEGDPTYKALRDQWNKQWLAYTVLKSLEPSNIEWERVRIEDPSTWVNWEQELLDNGFAQGEVNRVLALAMEANSLDEKKLERARELFLQQQVPLQES